MLFKYNGLANSPNSSSYLKIASIHFGRINNASLTSFLVLFISILIQLTTLPKFKYNIFQYGFTNLISIK